MRALVPELVDKILSNPKEYQDYRGDYNTFEVAAKLECSSNTAREVIARVRLKLTK